MAEQAMSFVKSLAQRFQEASPILDHHLRDNGGELLPHVFFGDLTRHIVDVYAETGGQESESLRDILDFLEDSYVRADHAVRNLIEVSFLENLPASGEEWVGIRQLLGPNLARTLREMKL